MSGVFAGLFFALGIFLVVAVLTGQLPAYVRPLWVNFLMKERVSIAYSLLSGILAFFAIYVMSNNRILAAVVALFAIFIPKSIHKAHVRKEYNRARQQWPDILDDIVSALRSGMTIADAVSVQSERAPQELRPFFRDFAAEYQSSGRVEDSFTNLKERMNNPVADKIIEAMRMAHSLGGHDLGITLTSLAGSLRRENQSRGELLARQSWTVGGAKVAAAAPWIVLAMLASRPGFRESFTDTTGTLVLLGGFLATVLAYVLMLRLGTLPESPRVLGGQQ